MADVQRVETLKEPTMYSPTQLQHAYAWAVWFDRGKFVLTERPYKL